jgi:hypothetical protein
MPARVDPTDESPSSKRARHSRPGAAAAGQASLAQAQADGEADEFSDDEMALDAAVDWELKGFDFSGCPGADSTQLECDMCAEAFEVSWHAEKEELVVSGAVLLCNRVYHQRCADERLGLLQLPRRRLEAAA